MGCSSPFQQQHYDPPNTLIRLRPFGSLGYKDLAAASLALTSIDHILLLGHNGLNDVAMRAGMGWEGSLRDKRWRWCVYTCPTLFPIA